MARASEIGRVGLKSVVSVVSVVCLILVAVATLPAHFSQMLLTGLSFAPGTKGMIS